MFAASVIVNTSGAVCFGTVIFNPALICNEGGSVISKLTDIGVDVILGPNEIYLK
jgi:hypothetical protein